jgi:hypothetical protein
MSKRIAVLIAATSIGVASWVWFQQPEAGSPSIAPAKATRAASTGDKTSPAADQARVFSAKSPVLQSNQLAEPEVVAEVNTNSRRWATVTTAPSEDAAPARRVTAAAPSSKRLSSAKPGDDEARLQLVRDIQYELKRAGCYDGEIHGHWSNTTKGAMKTFTDRVNAALPVEEPDYILLTLVQNQARPACKGEPPRATVAQQQPRGQHKPTASELATSTPHASAPAQTPAANTDANQGNLAREPLPGRMAIGAPIAGTSERQDVALDEARRRDQAALDAWRAQGRGDGDRAGALPEGPDGVVGPPPHLADTQHRKPRTVRMEPKRPPLQRGSTRQVFSGLVRSAP